MTKKGKKKQQKKQNVSTLDITCDSPSTSQPTPSTSQQQQQQTKPQKETSQPSVEKLEKPTQQQLPKPTQQQLPTPPKQQLQGVWAKRQQQQSSTPSTLQQQQQQVPWQQPQQAKGQSPQQQQQVQQQQPQGVWQQQQQQQIPIHPQKQQAAWGQPPPQQQQQQQQQIPTQPSQQQPQGAWGRPPPPQQQQILTQPSQQQPQGAWGQPPPQQQQQIPTQLSQQQPQAAWGRPPSQQQQQQQIPTQPSQQQPQIPTQPSQQQPQGAWGQPPPQQQQQIPTQLSQQQPQAAWGQPPPPQQQQQIPTQPLQQQPQGARGQPPPQQQQQIPTQLSQQQPQAAWGRPPPQQQQQQIPTQPSQQQLQGAWGPPPQQQQQQQQIPTHLLQQQPQGAWMQQQPQIPIYPPQQQAWSPSCQQQTIIVDVGGAGDSREVQDIKRDNVYIEEPQPSTSAQSLKVAELSLRDTLQSIKTSKTKMTSSAMKSYQSNIPKRRDPKKSGTLGTPIRVLTNMFEIIFNKNFVTNAIHYDVTIEPNASKSMHKQVFDKCRSTHFCKRYPAYDGKKNAYSANNLPFNDYMETEIEIFDHERDKLKTFKIALKKVAAIDLSWIKNLQPGLDEADRDLTGLQVLDVVMRHAAEMRCFSIGRSMYWKIDPEASLGRGLCLGSGGFLSAIAGWKPYLNVDVAHKGFPSPKSIVEIMAEFKDDRDRRDTYSRSHSALSLEFATDELEKIDKFLKGLKVAYQIPNQDRSKRTYRINGLGPIANKHKFDCNNKLITITEYFAEHKNYKLNYPELPCLWVGATDRKERIYLPAELCTIVAGQSYNRKLDDKQTTNMIRKVATDAPTRQRRIEDAFRQINVNNSPNVTQEFNLSVCPKMKEVDARILPPPELEYANMTIAKVNRGIWQLHPFKRAESLSQHEWTILDLSRSKKQYSPDMNTLSKMLKSNASSVGMQIGEPAQFMTIYDNRSTRDIMNFFVQCKNRNLKLVIVIIPGHTDATYSKVKQISELNVGVLTQCIKADTVRKMTNNQNITTVKNILLKINSKLNGINHTFKKMPKCLQNNSCCMLVGADVTHPSPDSVNIPSIAAVAASQDTVAFKYNAELRLQQPKEEIIVDLENIITSQIITYQRETNCLPKKIIYYRDGVSEGQLAQVMYFEINAIRKACKKLTKSNKDIEVTCLVVQKRHHVRLFPTRPEDSDDRNRNVKAGTIVDTEITHPNHIDFYLVSHASIQGTARPTKYRCICNDSNYTEDEIEELTYYLCHMYARCARAVSYPAPTYYAHLAAYRGRALIQGTNIRLDNLNEEQAKLKMKLQSPMFYV